MMSLLFSYPSLSIAAGEAVVDCEKEALRFGDGEGKDKISSSCYKSYLKSANPQAIKKSDDGKFMVYGYKNIVFIKDPKSKVKQNVITGNNTLLTDIVATALDEKNNEIAVIEKSGDILFFSSIITGNVSPLRVLKHKDLEGASDLVFNTKRGEILILNKDNKEILSFSRLANIHGREGKKFLTIVKAIRNIKGEALAIDPEHQELFVLTTPKDTLTVFNLDPNLNVPAKTIPLPKKEVREIYYSSQTDEIIALDPTGISKIKR